MLLKFREYFIEAVNPRGRGFVVNEKKELTAEELVKKLTRKAPQDGEFSLNDVTIRGKLDLRHRIIPVAVALTNCIFTDEVDLRYCEFKQCVDFSGSHFEKDFNSGDETNSFTIYQKDLICNNTVFEGGASFNGARCEGSGYFHNAKFENTEKEINFVHATFGGNLECVGTIFKGGASFNCLRCEESGFFHNAQFENPKKKIDFGHATFGRNLDCTEAIFKGGARFNTLQCEGTGVFENARFENLEEKIDFGYATFGDHLDCTEAIFRGDANFSALKCEGTGFFKNAQFENPKKEINFVHAAFGINLECQGKTTFAGKVNFRYVQISGVAILRGTEFQNSVSFNGAAIHSLSMRDPKTDYGSGSFPFEKKDIDLRRCTFEIFEGTKEQQKHIVDAQSLEKFSQDPYLQFEQYYRSIGDEAYAKKIYYDGRRVLRKNALRRYALKKSKRQERNSEIRWPLWRVISDWGLRWMVGYGVRMGRSFILILILLCLGTSVFWSDGALVPKDAKSISAVSSVAEQPDKADEAAQTGNKDKFFTHLCHRLWYSLDLFIPIVNLRIIEGYKRFHGWRAAYGVVHIIMGWILVPLLIASLSGVIKK